MRRLLRTIKKTIFVCVAAFACLGTAYVGGYLPKDIQTVERIRTVTQAEPALIDLLQTVPPTYGVSPVLVAAMVKQESNGRLDAYRFEPSQMERAAKFTKDEQQQRMLASSHCAMQVMGYNAARLGLSWSELYDAETCVEVGVKILRECFDRQKGGSKYERIRGALACYNGSEKYADLILSRIGRALIEENL